jgi:hypothetical protein
MVMNFDEILLELSYRVEGGIINFTKKRHRDILCEILKENNVVDSEQIVKDVAFYAHLIREDKNKMVEANPQNVIKLPATPFEAYIAALMSRLKNSKILDPETKVKGIRLGDGQILFQALKKLTNLSGEYNQFEGKTGTSEKWKEWTGKGKDTAKTDILGNTRISLKRGKSQLISPKKEELIATFQAAGEITGITKKLREQIKEDVKQLTKIANKFVDDGKTNQGLDVGELKAISSDRGAYNKKQKEKGEETFTAKLSAQNRKAMELIEEVNRYHRKMEKEINGMVESNPIFIKAMIYEAGSGEIKFGDSEPGRAEWLLAVRGDISDVKLMSMKNMNSEAINYLQSKVLFKVGMKSTGYGPKGSRTGYDFFSSLRVQIEDIEKNSKQLNETIQLFNSKKHLLTESILDDFAKKIKDGWNWLIDKIQKIWEWIKEVGEKALKLIESGLDNICKVVGLEPEIDASVEFDAL